jgi:bacterioferritin
MRGEMTEEIGHADAFLRRIMFLKGEPEVRAAQAPHRARDLSDMFEADLRDETASIAFYTEAARTASDASDIGTRRLFEKIALDEEGHKAWLELQISLVKRMGEPAYFAMEIGTNVAEQPA